MDNAGAHFIQSGMYVNGTCDRVRKTKAEAEKTRRRIMASALRVFDRRGIARTTLEQIAKDAGVTRGAIYWHFTGKQDLLRAIRDSVSLPLLDQSDLTLLQAGDDDPLERVQRFLAGLVRTIDADSRTRRALDVMSFKCEYVGELAAERGALVRNTDRLRAALEHAYTRSRERGILRDDLSPQVAALETVAFVSGLVRLLLLDAARTGMRKWSLGVIRGHVQSRRVANETREHRARKGTGTIARPRPVVDRSTPEAAAFDRRKQRRHAEFVKKADLEID